MSNTPQSEPQKVLIEKLVEDFTMYPRSQVDGTTVERYTDALKSGSMFPAIRVDAKSMRIIDGFHRVAAHKKAGLKEIDAFLEKPRGESDFYRRAVAANNMHGRPYSKWDHKRIIARAKELGIKTSDIAIALRLPLDRLDKLTFEAGISQSSGLEIPLKTTIKHMEGKKLTPYQEEVNATLGGMRPTHYVNTVIKLLDADLIDWDNGVLVRLLHELQGKLFEKLPAEPLNAKGD